jgi:hypothetical protein
MATWAGDELDSIAVEGSQFKLRAVRGEPGVPAINFAVFDTRAVFIIVTMNDSLSFSGIGIESREVAAYFDAYFELLYAAADPLEEALVARAKGGWRTHP